MRLTFLSFSLLHAMKICMVCIAAYGAKLRLKYNICNTCQKHFSLTKNNVHQKRLPDEGKFYPNGPIRVLCF